VTDSNVSGRERASSDPRAEVKRLVALAVASGVVTYRELAARAGRSKTLAQHWGDTDEDGDLPAFTLLVDEGFRAFMLPQLEQLAAREAARRPRSAEPEVGANVVFARIGEWMTAAATALADGRVDASEAPTLVRVATDLRGALDRLIEQLTQRASEPPAPPGVARIGNRT
jgi:hypothetical protein